MKIKNVLLYINYIIMYKSLEIFFIIFTVITYNQKIINYDYYIQYIQSQMTYLNNKL